MATDNFIGIALEDTSQDILSKVDASTTEIASIKTGVDEVKTEQTAQASTLSTISEAASTAATKAEAAATAAGTASTNAAEAKTAANNALNKANSNGTTLGTINTNVNSIKTTVGTINTNTATSANADACAKTLQTLVALDPTNLRFDAVNCGIVMNHSTYGWIEMVAIAFNVDGANYVTLKAAGPVAQSAWGTSGQDWVQCTARTWCRGTFYNGIPAALRNRIKTVNKKVYTRAGSVGTNAETVWLLSATELGAAGSAGGGVAEGAPYAYFNGSRALGAMSSGSQYYQAGTLRDYAWVLGCCALRSVYSTNNGMEYNYAYYPEYWWQVVSQSDRKGHIDGMTTTDQQFMVPCFCVA